MGAQAVRLSNVDIDNALKNKDFEVLFQPIFDLGNGALARVKTFVRWRHPRLGLLPPGAFISFFESQGRMSELTRYVLGNALSAYMDWRGPWPPGLSVNLALSDLSDEAFTSHFTKLLRDYDFPPDLITLECPMPPVDMPPEAAAAHFDRLANTGARLAIEVRGRANDLLRSLDPFPFDEIKTGGSAILRFARTVRGPGLSAIADLLDVASKANAAITAVGVEDQASLSALRGLGFTAAQGNHLGKVGDLKEFRPNRINEVRELLGLAPLNQENITALFRTDAPVVQAPEQQPEEETETEDALIGRLNERMAQFGEAAEETKPDEEAASATGQTAPAAEAADVETAAASSEADAEEDKKARAREKAKALALA
ncbi:MAG: EAL domain-containing protein, partial [Oricola sp.]|nr:EAL domain-containing protein [Oricola sp.]